MEAVAEKIISADKTCRSWREKLDFVRGLFFEKTPPSTNDLVDIAIYLRFLGTGQIRCAEDGRHFRPSHHANIASEIHQRLAELSKTDAAWIARKIYPSLPSTAQAFQRAEPLTIIRDIAHRNDIPHELKTEIKTTLQNKLHRCAGPEDLATSAKLLERVTAPGANYSGDFVEQFKIFHEELKEFFNARSLDMQLAALQSQAAPETEKLIGDFLANRNRKALPDQLNTFRTLSELREKFHTAVADGTHDASEVILADVALEDFGFVLLSEMLNAFEAEQSSAWEPLLDALTLALRNLILSGIEPEECRAIESELRAWREQFDASDSESLLRLKASSERTKRVAETFSDRIIALFLSRAETLGRALGVEEHSIRVFCEAEIRGHLVFQLAKLISNLLRRIREALTLPAWDVIVSGRASGRVQIAARLDELNKLRERTLVLLKHADGDEEIPTAIAGVVLAHELPHLSHLGVRARQAGVVFVACEDATKFEELGQFRDKQLTLVATADQFELTDPSEFAPKSNGKSNRVEIPALQNAPMRPCISLAEASAKNSGGKSDGARRLDELANEREEFKTPLGCVVPFGVMENSLHSVPDLESEYRSLVGRIDGASADEFSKSLDRLQEIIQQLQLPEAILIEAKKHFGNDARLIVRSSANCEDLEQLAGAGLYDSIANVKLENLAGAIHNVWASLWTRRATLSRKQAGIPHDRAQMAVLIQQMLVPDFSFVLHTTNPINNNANEVYAELAVGLGETLASAAAPGNPYRLVCAKDTGEVKTLALASFSFALVPEGDGVGRKRLDYSRERLSHDSEFRRELGKRLAVVGFAVEQAFGKPQDIEGAVIGEEIYLVQSRSQQGIQKSNHESTQPKTTKKLKAQPSRKSSNNTQANKKSPAVTPLTLGLFEKRIDGDDCLMDLARLRFQQANMGAEMHAGTAEHLEWVMKYRPSPESPVTLHLPREFNLSDANCRQRIYDFASRFAGRIHGMIIHDSNDLANRSDEYVRAAREMNSHLQQIARGPFLFVEYAVGLEPEIFANFFKAIRDLNRVSVCVDIGHVGIRQARKAYAQLHPNEDICALKSQPPNLPARMNDVEHSVQSALPVVLELIRTLATLDKPMHFHLHDGHPLSTFSPYGVSDHLSFLGEIPLNFEYRARRSAPLMFGRDGLFKISSATLQTLRAAQASFTLEIHPPDGRTPLGDAAPIFNHWTDKTNAEKMNHWLNVLTENHRLLREAIALGQ